MPSEARQPTCGRHTTDLTQSHDGGGRQLRSTAPFSTATFLFWALEARIDRAAAAFGRHPVDYLIRVHDVARLAVDAVGEVDLQALARILEAGERQLGRAGRARHHLVHVRRAE